MTYLLNGVNLSTFGAIPSPNTGDCYALTGIFDLPARKGTTERNWGVEIEPWVDAEDISIDGRTITLRVYIASQGDVKPFTDACIACTEISCDLGTYQVICKDEIKIDERAGYVVTVSFWQNKVEIPDLYLEPSGGDISIDGYGLLDDFGITVMDSDSLYNVASRIDVSTTGFYSNVQHRGVDTIEIDCGMMADAPYNKIQQLQALLVKPGIRKINVRGKERSFYYKDGIAVSAPHREILKFKLKLVAI